MQLRIFGATANADKLGNDSFKVERFKSKYAYLMDMWTWVTNSFPKTSLTSKLPSQIGQNGSETTWDDLGIHGFDWKNGFLKHWDPDKALPEDERKELEAELARIQLRLWIKESKTLPANF